MQQPGHTPPEHHGLIVGLVHLAHTPAPPHIIDAQQAA
eukprot:COSAG01_NODE_4497_length_4973_cov_63.459171_1_plen_37_part_10